MTDALTSANRLSWTIARYVADLPRGSAFAASNSAVAGIRLAQELLGNHLALTARGGGYDVRSILALHARHWLYNQHPRGFASLAGVFDTLSEPSVLLATPGQVDGEGNANLSTIGDHAKPKVAFGGTRGLPDAGLAYFVLPLHSSRSLVRHVDFVSTSVTSRPRPALLFTELCVMRWNLAKGVWQLIAAAPGTSPASIAERTGFAFETGEVETLQDPPPEALEVLRRVDPMNLRAMDFLTKRSEQWDAMARVYGEEMAMLKAMLPPEEMPRGWW